MRIAVLLLSAAAVASATPPATAGPGGDAFVGGLVGSVVGGVISNQINQRQQPQRVIVQQPRSVRQPVVVNSGQREENRRVQTALNYFGFPAGVADGVMGPNSRQAVATYQGFVGLPATGVLADYDRAFLLTSYDRAIAGGPQAAQLAASTEQGTRGLLTVYRQEALGGPQIVAMAPQPMMPQAVIPQAVMPEPAVPQHAVQPQQAVQAAPVPVAQPAPAQAPVAKLPSFMPSPAPAVVAAASIAAECNKVSIAINANAGPVSMFDVDFTGGDIDGAQVLAEQFCVARSHAIDQGQTLVAAVEAFTPAEMQTQCEAFTPTMRPYMMRLPGREPGDVNAEIGGFLAGTGADAAQMSGTARICLGIGYATDNAELALASALVLTGLGEASYGEFVGYHLIRGYGVAANCDCGLKWDSAAIDALDAGATPVVPDPDGERSELLAFALTGMSPADAAPTQASAPAAPAAKAFALPKAP